MNQIQAVIFDHDGTMVDSETARRNATAQFVMESCGMDLANEHYRLMMRVIGRHEPTQLLMKHYPISGELEALSARRLELFQEEWERWKLMPGVREVLGRASKMGLKLGVASNSEGDYVCRSLDTVGVLEMFDVVVGREDLVKSNGKPDPEIYQIAADRLEASPENCVVFEDAPSGVYSARDAGIGRIIYVSDGRYSEPFCSDAHVNLKSMCEVSEATFRKEILGNGERLF